MSKVYSGRDGVLQLSGTTLAKVVSFSVQSNLETLETTALNENLRSYIPGVSGYSGSATLLYYKDADGNVNTTNLLSKLYRTGPDGVSSSDTVQLTFRWIDGTDNNDITLTAYITSASIGAATGDIVRAEISFQGTGELNTVTVGT
jgi:phenylacetate-coenzyme A ligase PaaK-like adenylate-forming protein